MRVRWSGVEGQTRTLSLVNSNFISFSSFLPFRILNASSTTGWLATGEAKPVTDKAAVETSVGAAAPVAAAAAAAANEGLCCKRSELNSGQASFGFSRFPSLVSPSSLFRLSARLGLACLREIGSSRLAQLGWLISVSSSRLAHRVFFS